MATEPTVPAVYNKGSLAALRAEHASKKCASDTKNSKDILMMSASKPINGNNTSIATSFGATIDEAHDTDKSPSPPPHHTSTTTPNGTYIDEYGFVLSEEEKKTKMAEIGSDEHRHIIRKQNERTHKWLHMLDNWDTYTTTKKAKLKSRIRKGIPSALRGKVWKHLLGISELTQQQKTYYAKLKYQSPETRFKASIDRDLDRTFPRHVLFTSNESNGKDSGRGKEALRNVLYAIANHDTEVGYTQGMGFIVALFLMLMTEEDAFWSLCRLLDQNGEYQLRGLYVDGLPLLHCRYYQFNELLLKFMPKVHEKIEDMGITPALYASKWFITIFCYEFPFEYVYRIWDIYLHEGIKFVFRVCLALVKLNEVEILKLDEFEDMMKYLQNIHCKKNCIANIEQLLHKAFDLALKHDHLEGIEQKYNREKLAEQRRKGRGRNKARDVSEMQPPAFLAKYSATKSQDSNELDKKSDEGSHSASSYVEDEPSSLIPNHENHEIIPPNHSEKNVLSKHNNNNSNEMSEETN